MYTYSNVKCLFCLYNNSGDEIMYEWKKYIFFLHNIKLKTNNNNIKMLFSCIVENILTAVVTPFKGNLKPHRSQVFEVTVTSNNQPAILTIMLNISYKLVSQNEHYKQSLRNYNTNKEKLEGVFLINECGNYKPVRMLNFN